MWQTHKAGSRKVATCHMGPTPSLERPPRLFRPLCLKHALQCSGFYQFCKRLALLTCCFRSLVASHYTRTCLLSVTYFSPCLPLHFSSSFARLLSGAVEGPLGWLPVAPCGASFEFHHFFLQKLNPRAPQHSTPGLTVDTGSGGWAG